MDDNQKSPQEEHVFEFIDEELQNSSLAESTPTKWIYNQVDFDKDLNDEQLKIVNNIKGPMLVIAGAGSGKTRTIVYSVAKLLVNKVRPSEIMLVTFTNKAANEMIKRVELLLGQKPKGIWAGTFHALANRFLRKYATTIGKKTNYTIMDESDSKSLMKLAIDKADVHDLGIRFPSSSVAKEILSFSINCNKSIRDVILWKYPQFDQDKITEKLKDVFRIYELKKAEDNLVDFDDLLVFWNKLLDEKIVAQQIAKNIKHILVDEYQDTNYIQDNIIFKIAKQSVESNVMVVGDDAQSIYAFRGANFQNILNFPKKYNGCETYKITYNYRSVPEILALANDSIKNNLHQFKKEMKTTRSPGLRPFQVNAVDDEEQAKFVANQILKLRSEGYELNEIAVLYRTGFHSMKIELELKAKNIPYEIRSGVAFFEKAHIKDVIVHLRIFENPCDEISWMRIFSMIQGIGPTSASKIFNMMAKTENPIVKLLDKDFFSINLKGERISREGKKNIVSHVKKLASFTSNDNPSEVISKIASLIEDYIKSKYTDWKDRLDDLKQLSIYAQKYGTIQKFLESLALNGSNIESKTVRFGDSKEEEKPVVLSTIHRAKGLEWGAVFVPMLCEDSFPSSQVVSDAEAYEEERRVFYVAITRAKDQLYLISPSIVQSYKGPQTARISQFVAELSPNVYQRSSVRFKQKKGVRSPSKNTNSIDCKKKESNSDFKTADELLKGKN